LNLPTNDKISICNFDSTLKRFNKYQDLDINTIPVAEKEINDCINSFADKEKDSLYILYQRVFYTSVNKLNDSLESKYSSVLEKITNEENDSIVVKFKQLLKRSGLVLQMTEGSYFVDVQNTYFYNLFKGKVSKSLDEYLRIRSIEMGTTFSEDAMLLISYDDLYNRIVVWEDFINSHQDFFLNKTAVKFFHHYLSVLLTGMDNTPAFSRENGVLNSELKSLYEKVIIIADLRESTDIITEYYNLLKANQFKQPKELNSFLERYDLYSVKAVQPLLR
jgi:hypothetical protein